MLPIIIAIFSLLCFLILGGLYKLLKGGNNPEQGNANRRTDVVKDWKLFLFFIVIAILLGVYLYDQGQDKMVNSIKNDERQIRPYGR